MNINIRHLHRAIMRCPSFNPTQTLTLMALINIVDWGTWSEAVSFKYLASEAGVSYGAVRRAIDHFIGLGLLTKQAQSNSRGHDKNKYIINISALKEVIAEYMPKKQTLDTPPAQSEHSPAQSEHSPAQSEHSPAQSEHSPLLNLSTPPAQSEHPYQSPISITKTQSPKTQSKIPAHILNPWARSPEEQRKTDLFIQEQNKILTAQKKAERDRALNWSKK